MSIGTVPNLGTIQDAASKYAVTTKTIRRWITLGLIHAERVGPRLIRVDLDSVQSRPLTYVGANND